MEKVVVITGGSRGIGLGLVQHYLEQENHVLTTATQPLKAESLLKLKENYPDLLEVFEFHAEDSQSVMSFAQDLGEQVGCVDLLINNAGMIIGDVGQSVASDAFIDLNFEAVQQVMAVNSIAPLILSKELLPLLRASTNAKVINISSGMGSLFEFQWPEHTPYCMSKAALNMVTRSLASVLNQYSVPVASVSPGWVKTDMGGPQADISVEDSVESVTEFIENLKIDQTGGFYRRDGQPIPF